jgi:hypothetical protein
MTLFIHVAVTGDQAQQNQDADVDLQVSLREVDDAGNAMADYLIHALGLSATAMLAIADRVVFDDGASTAYVRHPNSVYQGIYVLPDTFDVVQNGEGLIPELRRLFPEDWGNATTVH